MRLCVHALYVRLKRKDVEIEIEIDVDRGPEQNYRFLRVCVVSREHDFVWSIGEWQVMCVLFCKQT